MIGGYTEIEDKSENFSVWAVRAGHCQERTLKWCYRIFCCRPDMDIAFGLHDLLAVGQMDESARAA
jgi:hypothetical protein